MIQYFDRGVTVHYQKTGMEFLDIDGCAVFSRNQNRMRCQVIEQTGGYDGTVIVLFRLAACGEGFIENETAAFNMRFLYDLKHQYDEQRVSQLFSMFGLDLNSKKIVSKYSVGMRQKLGIIQAVMEDQNLLLFDEPTRGLDENSVAVFTNMINQYAKEGKCIIICAHDGVDGIEFTKKMELKNGTLKVLEN